MTELSEYQKALMEWVYGNNHKISITMNKGHGKSITFSMQSNKK